MPSRLPDSVFSAGGGLEKAVFVDVDGDGAGDGVFVLGNGSVVVGHNTGSDSFTSVTTLTSGVPPCSGIAGFDVNANGVVDGVLFGAAGAWLAVDMTVGVVGSAVYANAVSALLSFDCNSDGLLDLFVVALDEAVLLVNAGNGRFTRSAVNVSWSAASTGPSGGLLCDLNHDGGMDVLVYGGGSGGVVLFNNGNNGSFNVFRAVVSIGLAAAGNATDGSCGDIDNDGDADLVLTTNIPAPLTSLLINNGSGGFVMADPSFGPFNWTVTGAAVMVDVTGDGVLDVPAVQYVPPAGIVGANCGVFIRALGRSGAQNQFGATVCVSAAATGTIVSCVVVDGGGGRNQALYDVHVGVPGSVCAAAGVNVSIGFVGGHIHSWRSAAMYGRIAVGSLAWPAVVILRDVPAIASVLLLPSTGVLPAGTATKTCGHVLVMYSIENCVLSRLSAFAWSGSTLSVIVTAMWAEAGLVPVPGTCCFVNNVNVAASMTDFGNGTYILRYTVAASDNNFFVRAPSLQVCAWPVGNAMCGPISVFAELPVPKICDASPCLGCPSGWSLLLCSLNVDLPCGSVACCGN